MKKVLLYLWQLPQNILGLLVILFTGAKCTGSHWIIKNPDSTKYFGVSLGSYIIFGNYPREMTLKHEHGHQKQSWILGPLYLLVIGLPSLLGNIYSRIFHKSAEWYYKQPWEAWADKLGGVER